MRREAEGSVGAGGITVHGWHLSDGRRSFESRWFGYGRHDDDELVFRAWNPTPHCRAESLGRSQPDCVRRVVELRACCGNDDSWI